jgi:hypothetical protein
MISSDSEEGQDRETTEKKSQKLNLNTFFHLFLPRTTVLIVELGIF